MDKVILNFKPELMDYSRVTSSYSIRNRSYWIGLGIVTPLFLFLLVLPTIRLFEGDFGGLFLVLSILVILVFLFSHPSLNERSFVRGVAKKEQLTLPITFEIDEETVVIANQIAEAKYSWDIFNKAFENEQYFFLSLSANNRVIQFIPKRAFVSQEQENNVRLSIIRHLGEIENIQKGFRGWKLSLLVAVIAALIFALVIGLVLISIFGFDGSPKIFHSA